MVQIYQLDPQIPAKTDQENKSGGISSVIQGLRDVLWVLMST